MNDFVSESGSLQKNKMAFTWSKFRFFDMRRGFCAVCESVTGKFILYGIRVCVSLCPCYQRSSLSGCSMVVYLFVQDVWN